jgi:hypothetical protein
MRFQKFSSPGPERFEYPMNANIGALGGFKSSSFIFKNGVRLCFWEKNIPWVAKHEMRLPR